MICLKRDFVSDHTDHALGNRCIDDVAALIAVDPYFIITFSIHYGYDYGSVAVFPDCEVDHGIILIISCDQIADGCA